MSEATGPHDAGASFDDSPDGPFGGGRVPDPLALARHYADTGQLPRALEETQRRLQEDPESIEAHLFLGFLLLEMDQVEDALAEAEGLLARHPEFAQASLLEALALSQLGRNREAERAHLDALRLEPENPNYLRLYGRLMLSVGQPEKAEALVRAALERDPTDEDAHALLGLIQLRRGRGSDAVASGATAISHAPDEAVGHLAHAAASFRTGRVFRARRHCREALRLDPTNGKAQEFYDTVDLHARLPALPLYYWGLLIGKLPGHAFAVWGIFIVLVYGLPELGVSQDTVTSIAIGYVVFCLYTWVALPITRAWRRVIPLRI